MSILDTLTGGKSKEASDALKRAEAYFGSIAVPTKQELSLPELEKYVQAGILTPAEAKTMLQQGNAFNDINLSPKTTEDQTDVLSKLKDISSSGGMTPQMRAQLTSALDQVATNTRGNNAATSELFAQRGIPSSLMAEAAMREEAGTNARDANLSATQAAGTAEQNAMNALMNEGNLATTMGNEQYSEAANKAAAENAMRQWNAAATNQGNEANAARGQQTNIYNQTTKQNVADSNTGLSNQRTQYNATVPQTIFEDAYKKAAGQAGAATNYGDMINKQASQQGAINTGIVSQIAKSIPNPIAQGLSKTAGNAQGSFEDKNPQMYSASEGGAVPGKALVPGDSLKNDKVHALLSPGEVVVPRSIAPHPDAVKRFVQHLAYSKPIKPVHHEDVRSVLDALSARRG